MPIYCYECEWCHEQKNVKHSINDNPEMRCNKCDGKMFRIVSGGTGFIFKEGVSPVSDKPDSYWSNAEQNRLNAVKKRRKEAREKLHYRDPETIQKLENRARNEENTGKIEKAKQTKRLLDGI